MSTIAFTTLAGVHTKSARRDATTVFFTFVFPLVFLLLFGTIFRGQDVEQSGRGYIDYIAPGVLTWGVANAAVFGIAFALMQWRESDLLRIVRMTPTHTRTVLSSKLMITLGIAAVQSILFVGVAMLPFFGLSLSATSWQAVPLLVMGVVAFYAVGAIIGALANTAEAVAAVSNVIMVPMAFLSGSFFPIDMMPEVLQTIAHVLPLYYLTDGVGAAFTGEATTASFLTDLGMLAAFAALFTAIAVKVFRWSND